MTRAERAPQPRRASSIRGGSIARVPIVGLPLVATALLGTLLSVACTGDAEPLPDPEPAVSHEAWVRGPALDPSSELLAWLEGERGDRRVRLPVVVEVTPIGVTGAWVGTDPDRRPADALRLRLDEAALGVPLADRLRATCPAGGPCAVWLEGTWGPLIDAPSAPAPDGAHVFAVREVVGPVQGAPGHLRIRRAPPADR